MTKAARLIGTVAFFLSGVLLQTRAGSIPFHLHLIHLVLFLDTHQILVHDLVKATDALLANLFEVVEAASNSRLRCCSAFFATVFEDDFADSRIG